MSKTNLVDVPMAIYSITIHELYIAVETDVSLVHKIAREGLLAKKM